MAEADTARFDAAKAAYLRASAEHTDASWNALHPRDHALWADMAEHDVTPPVLLLDH